MANGWIFEGGELVDGEDVVIEFYDMLKSIHGGSPENFDTDVLVESFGYQKVFDGVWLTVFRNNDRKDFAERFEFVAFVISDDFSGSDVVFIRDFAGFMGFMAHVKPLIDYLDKQADDEE